MILLVGISYVSQFFWPISIMFFSSTLNKKLDHYCLTSSIIHSPRLFLILVLGLGALLEFPVYYLLFTNYGFILKGHAIHSSLQRQGLQCIQENCFLTQDTTPLPIKFILIVYNICNETESESKLKAVGRCICLRDQTLKAGFIEAEGCGSIAWKKKPGL